MTTNKQDMLEHVKKVHENIALTLGTVLAMILVTYFFTYSALADSNHAQWLWFEGVSSVLIVVALIYLRRIALAMTKLRFSKNKAYQELLQPFTVKDL